MLSSLLTSSQLFAASTAVGLIGTGVGAVAQYQGYKAQQQTAAFNAAQARQTAAMEENRSRRNAQRQLASARAAQGASGVLVGQGSNLAVLSDLAAQQEENALNIRYGGEVNRANALNRATAYGQQATGSLIGGVAGVGKGLLGGAYEYSREFPD